MRRIEQFLLTIPRHLKSMRSLLSLRGMPPELVLDLPSHGYMAFDELNEPIAAGFLRMVEGKFGLIDGFITNEHMDSETRHLALSAIGNALVEDAHKSHISHLLVIADDPSMEKRALFHGFKPSTAKLMTRSLNGGIGIWHS